MTPTRAPCRRRFAPADLLGLVREAGLVAIQDGAATRLSMHHFDTAMRERPWLGSVGMTVDHARYDAFAARRDDTAGVEM